MNRLSPRTKEGFVSVKAFGKKEIVHGECPCKERYYFLKIYAPPLQTPEVADARFCAHLMPQLVLLSTVVDHIAIVYKGGIFRFNKGKIYQFRSTWNTQGDKDDGT